MKRSADARLCAVFSSKLVSFPKPHGSVSTGFRIQDEAIEPYWLGRDESHDRQTTDAGARENDAREV